MARPGTSEWGQIEDNEGGRRVEGRQLSLSRSFSFSVRRRVRKEGQTYIERGDGGGRTRDGGQGGKGKAGGTAVVLLTRRPL